MITNSKEENEKLLKVIMHHLIRFKFLAHSVADKVAIEFSQFVENEIVTNKDKFMKFDRSCEQLDQFYFDDNLIRKLSKTCFCFEVYITLSHGNASVERGFSQ